MTDMNVVTDVLGKLKACQMELQGLASSTHDKKEKQKFRKIEQSLRQCQDMLDGTIDNEINKQSQVQNNNEDNKKEQNSVQRSTYIKIPDLD